MSGPAFQELAILTSFELTPEVVQAIEKAIKLQVFLDDTKGAIYMTIKTGRTTDDLTAATIKKLYPEAEAAQ